MSKKIKKSKRSQTVTQLRFDFQRGSRLSTSTAAKRRTCVSAGRQRVELTNQHTSEIILTYSSPSADSFLYYLDESADEDEIT